MGTHRQQERSNRAKIQSSSTDKGKAEYVELFRAVRLHGLILQRGRRSTSRGQDGFRFRIWARRRVGNQTGGTLGPPWTTPTNGWLVWMLPVEIGDEGPIHNPTGRYPGSLLRTITLPVDKVLDAPSSTPGPEKTPDGVDWSTINEAWRRRGRRSRDQRTLMNRFDL